MKIIRYRVLILSAALPTLIILGVFIVYTSLQPKITEAAWFNDNWAYRQKITFTHNADVSSDRRITVTVDTATLITNGKMQSDCDDTRFTDADGNVLKYQLTGTCNNAATTYDVVFTKVFNGANLAYIYYGNPQASSLSQDVSSTTSLSPSGADLTVSSEEQGTTPVLYWRFDDSNVGIGTTAGDSTQFSNVGTVSGASYTTEDLCVAGKCLKFDGSNDFVSKTYSSDTELNPGTGSFTVTAYFKHASAISGTDTIISRADAVNGVGYKVYMNSSGNICFGIDDTAGSFPADSTCSTTTYNDSKWHQATGVKNGTSLISLYIDGNFVTKTTVTATGSLSGSSPTFYVGIDADGASNPWDGFLDEIKYYNFLRIDAQIKADYTGKNSEGGSILGVSDPKPLSDGLVGYWRMDESSGNAADSSGNVLTLTNNNSTAYAASKFGNGGSFTAASSHYFSTATTISGVKTIAFWVNPSSNTDDFINLTASAYINSSSGTVSATGFTSPSIYVNGVLNGTVTANVWNHVLVTTDTGINANAFEVGRANSAYVDGKMDEVRVYNRTLSPAEISQLYNFAPGPKGQWKFDGSIYDSSGNGYNATLNSNATYGVGKFDRSLSVNGGSDYASAPTISNIQTVSFWVKPTSVTSTMMDINTSGPAYISSSGAGAISATGFTSPTYYVNGIAGATNLVANTWQYVTVTTSTGLSGSAIKIGQANGTSMTGFIDQVTVYDYVRTPKQIIEDMNAGHPSVGTPVGSTVGYWRFDEGTGLSAYDKTEGILDSGTATTGTTTRLTDSNKSWISNAWVGHTLRISSGTCAIQSRLITANGTSPGTTDFAALSGCSGTTTSSQYTITPANDLNLSAASWTNNGKFGKAWNGTGAVWVSRPDDSDFDFAAAADLTISLWFKSDSATNPGASEYLIDKGTTARYSIYLDTSGQPNFTVNDGTNSDTITISTDIYDATWHHIVATKTGTARTDLYIDGILRGSDTSIATTATLANADSLTLGDSDATDNGDEFNGDLDEVKIYRSALTTEQVKTEYNKASSLVLGALSDNTAFDKMAGYQEYCVPGDQSTCNLGIGQSGPSGEWKFDENFGVNITADSSTNGNDGTLGGNVFSESTDPTWVAGKYGSALSFNGGNSIALGSNPSIDDIFTGGGTITAWIKPRTASTSTGSGVSSGAIFAKRSGGGGTGWYSFVSGLTSSRVKLELVYYWGNTANWITTSTELPLNQWSHIAIIYNSSTTVKPAFYVNGRSVAITTTTSPTGSVTTDASTNAFIGAIAANGSQGFEGAIDNVRWYSYTLNPNQIAWDYNRGGPVGYWKMDECQGATVNDSSGFGNSGTITIGGTGTQTSATDMGDCSTSAARPWYNGKTGKINYSVNLDGTDDYISTGSFADLSSSGIGVSGGASWGGWFYPKTSAASKTLIDKGNEYRLTTDSSSQPVCGIYYSGSYTDAVAGSQVLGLNSWNNVLCSYDGTNIKTYLNGRLIGTTANTNPITVTSSTALHIGQNSSSSQRFEGQVDEIRIFNYGLTQSQVLTNYTGGAVRFGPTTGPP